MNFNNERGNTALYTLLLLPVALLFSAIAVDVSGWNMLRGKLQEEADRLAFQALGALPSSANVRARVDAAAGELRRGGVEAEVFFPASLTSAVGVTLYARYSTTFDFLLSPRLKRAFHVRRSGVAQLVPGDYVLIVVDGSTLRPRLMPGGATGSFSYSSWGDALDWPASRYFECISPPVVSEPNALDWHWWQDWQKEDFRRWATQSCFNPVLSPLKRAAIGLAEGLMAYNTNRLSLLFTPGTTNGSGFRAARHIHGESESVALYRNRIGGFASPGSPLGATFGNYLELDRFLGDEVCMLLTRPEAGLGSTYELASATSLRTCSDPLRAPPCGGRHFASGHFSECYLTEAFTLRDAVYWNAAKLPVPGFDAKPDIAAALRQAWAELTDDRASAAEKLIRGNLARNALREVFVLTDTLPPRASELGDLLTAFQSRGIELVLVPFFHEGLDGEQTEALRAAITEWQELANSHVFRVSVSPASSPEELEQSVAPRLLARAFQFALRS